MISFIKQKIKAFWNWVKKTAKKILIGIGAITVVAAAGTQTSLLDTSPINYPLLANTNEDKVEFLYEAMDVLNIENANLWAKVEREEMTMEEWQDYIANDYLPKRKWIGWAQSKIGEKLTKVVIGTTTSTTTEDIVEIKEDGRQAFKKDFKNQAKWNVDLERILSKKEVIFYRFSNLVKNWISELIVLAHPGVQDFSVYTEVDPGSDITTTTNTVSFNLPRDRDSYVYAASSTTGYFFDADFQNYITINATSSDGGSHVAFWTLAKVVDDMEDIEIGAHPALEFFLYTDAGPTHKFFIREHQNDGGDASDIFTGNLTTVYYIDLWRDDDLGGTGTVYADIYGSAANRSAQAAALDNLSVALEAQEDFGIVYAVQSYNDGNADAILGQTKDLDLEPSLVAPTPVKVIPMSQVIE